MTDRPFPKLGDPPVDDQTGAFNKAWINYLESLKDALSPVDFENVSVLSPTATLADVISAVNDLTNASKG